MLRSVKLLLSGVTLGVGSLLSGCAATNQSAESDPAPSTQGVMCMKCQVTWVKVPTHTGKSRIVHYSNRKQMVCPDCKDAVANFFSTGNLQHACKTCGDSMQICEAH